MPPQTEMQQMNYEQQMMAQVAQANKAHEAQVEAKTASNPLDIVPDLKGDRDRQQFVVKVYSLITLMLSVTAGWSVVVYTQYTVTLWVYSNMWLYYGINSTPPLGGRRHCATCVRCCPL